MGIQTYSLPDELAEKFKNNTPERKTSKKLREIMREYLEDKDVEVEDQENPNEGLVNPIDLSSLTNKQKKLFKTIYENAYFGLNKAKMRTKAVKNHGVYSRTRSYREGIDTLVKNDSVPIVFKGGKIVSQQIDCPKCGSDSTLEEIKDEDGDCPWCTDTKYSFISEESGRPV